MLCKCIFVAAAYFFFFFVTSFIACDLTAAAYRERDDSKLPRLKYAYCATLAGE